MIPTRLGSTGAGSLTFSSALFLLVLGLVRGNDEGWGSPVIVSLLVGAGVLLAAFAVIEQRVSEPMLPLSLFRRRAFTGVQLAAFAVSGSMFALFLYLTLYLQSFLGYSPIEAGLRYLPITLASFIVAPMAGMALAKVQARWLMSAGLALTGVGLLLMGGLGVDSEWTALLLGFIVSGIGVGLLNPVIADVALSVVPKERSGMAAGINDTFRQVGIAVGIAAWGAIFLGAGASKTQELAGNAIGGDEARGLVEATSSGALPQAVSHCRSRFRARCSPRPNRASCTASTRSSCSAPCSPSPARSPPSGWSASATSTAKGSSKAPRSRPSRSPPGRRATRSALGRRHQSPERDQRPGSLEQEESPLGAARRQYAEDRRAGQVEAEVETRLRVEALELGRAVGDQDQDRADDLDELIHVSRLFPGAKGGST